MHTVFPQARARHRRGAAWLSLRARLNAGRSVVSADSPASASAPARGIITLGAIIRALSVALLFSTLAMAVLSADPPSRNRTADRLKEEYRYVPPAKETPPEKSDEVVTMEIFTVVESGERRSLERVMGEQARRAKEETYTIIKGGTLLKADVGRARIEVGTWSGGGGLEFLRISW